MTVLVSSVSYLEYHHFEILFLIWSPKYFICLSTSLKTSGAEQFFFRLYTSCLSSFPDFLVSVLCL